MTEDVRYTSEQILLLCNSKNYREFITLAMSARCRPYRKFGYSDIGRYGGFSSRSFPRDVCKGIKNITLKSLPGFIQGLGLSIDLAEYFSLLVLIEEKKLRTKSDTEDLLKQKIDKLKIFIISGLKNNTDLNHISNIAFQYKDIPKVYAALGSVDKGASVDEIHSRTNLPIDIISNLLAILISNSLIINKEDRYYANSTHLNMLGITQNEIFKSFYIDLLNQATSYAISDDVNNNYHLQCVLDCPL